MDDLTPADLDWLTPVQRDWVAALPVPVQVAFVFRPMGMVYAIARTGQQCVIDAYQTPVAPVGRPLDPATITARVRLAPFSGPPRFVSGVPLGELEMVGEGAPTDLAAN